MEQTLVLVKPDGVKKNLIGDIIARFEHKGLQGAALKLVTAPLVCAVIRGENAIKAVRQLNGATNPIEAVPGSIRGDFALSIGENIVHGSDSPEAAEREINNFFAPEEIY